MDGDVADQASATAATADSIHRLEFEVPWPPDHVAAYLLEGDESILFDAAVHGDGAEETLRSELDRIGKTPADVDHVVITHPHSDHIGQAPALHEAGATIHTPEPVLEQLERDEEALVEGVEEIGRTVGYEGKELEKAVEQARYSLQRNRMLLDPDVTKGLAVDGPITIGGRELEPIYTPGHQINHYCFETTVNGDRVLFAGDALIKPFRAGLFHVGIDYGGYESVAAFYDGLDALEGRDIDRVYPGHGPVFEDYNAVVEMTRDKLDKLVEDTSSALAAVEPATPVEVTTERFGEIEYPAPLLDTMGALGWLDETGRATYETEDGARYFRST